MNRYYYFTAMVFSPNGRVDFPRGTVKSEQGEFPLSYTIKKLAEKFNVDKDKVIITFYNEISKQEYDNLTKQ